MDTVFLPLMPDPELPVGLFERVSGAIQRAQLRRLFGRVVLAVLGFAVSLSYAIFEWTSFWQEASSSSFVEFLRLAVSDPDVVMVHVQDFAIGLLETLPISTIFMVSISAFFCIGAVIAFDALRHARRNPHTHSSLSVT